MILLVVVMVMMVVVMMVVVMMVVPPGVVVVMMVVAKLDRHLGQPGLLVRRGLGEPRIVSLLQCHSIRNGTEKVAVTCRRCKLRRLRRACLNCGHSRQGSSRSQ
jgi:hypothetical protein